MLDVYVLRYFCVLKQILQDCMTLKVLHIIYMILYFSVVEIIILLLIL